MKDPTTHQELPVENPATPLVPQSAATPTNAASQIPAVNRELKLQLFYATSLLKVNPGLGKKTDILARDLVSSGLKPSEAVALIQAAYSPNYSSGRGQATRSKHFSQAIQERYGDELEKISSSITTFRRMLMDMTDASEMRDILKGEDYSITFHEAFMYHELGINGENYLAMAQELRKEGMTPLAIHRAIREAAIKVKKDPSLSLECLVLKRENFGEEWDTEREEHSLRDYEIGEWYL